MSGEEADQAARFHIAVTHPLFANEGPAAKGPAGMFWWWIRRRCFHFAGEGAVIRPNKQGTPSLTRVVWRGSRFAQVSKCLLNSQAKGFLAATDDGKSLINQRYAVIWGWCRIFAKRRFARLTSTHCPQADHLRVIPCISRGSLPIARHAIRRECADKAAFRGMAYKLRLKIANGAGRQKPAAPSEAEDV